MSPNSSNDVYIPEVYPSSSHQDIRVDEGDSRDGKSFVPLLDEKSPQYQKRRGSDYKFRSGFASRKDKPEIIKQSKHKKEAASSGNFLNDIEPHQILLPSDSSDEIKDYDPDIYPEGTSLDIKEEEGDKDNINGLQGNVLTLATGKCGRGGRLRGGCSTAA